MSNQDWELKVVENAGEIPAEDYPEGITVPVKPLLLDIKTQLAMVPKRYVYTVGWRAYVWQEEKSGRFKDLTDEEFKRLLNEGTISYSRDAGTGSDVSQADTNGDEASDT